MHLTLLIPELLWSNPDDRAVYEALDASALARLLARTAPLAGPALPAERWLAHRFGYPGAMPPLAALRAAGDGFDAGDACWLAADPVHLRFHQERLILADASQLAITEDESATLRATLAETFADWGELHAAGDRWSLRLSRPVDGGWPALSEMVGREIRLETLLADPQLKRLGHEVQMQLHAHPVNRRREAAGALPINALWFWGGGRLPGVADRAREPLPRLFSDTPVALGLARCRGGASASPPPSLAALLATPSGDAIVEIDSLRHPAAFENAGDYLDAWRALDRDWFAGLAAALRSGRLRRLEIVAPTGYGLLSWSLHAASAWRFWGARRPLSARVAARVAASAAGQRR